MNFRVLLQQDKLIKLMLVCGLLQVAAYYVAGSLATDTAHVAVPQPDTLLYCQSARQVALGQPFVYTPGEKPSTGSTSHLYPFVLAATYKMGAHGDAILSAGFALNAFFYLLFLVNWGVIVKELVRAPRVRLVACALLALNGQAVYTALSQSDMGLFMAVSSGLLMCLVTKRMVGFTFLLVLAPWCRPEGVFLAGLLAILLGLRYLFIKERLQRSEWVAAGAGLVSAASLFVFNFWLTGTFQFQSVQYKGYFKDYDFLSALHLSLSDGIRIMRELFLGLPDALPRESFFVPLLGALCAWLGVVLLKRRRYMIWKELWWLAAGAIGIAVVASSGWQNTNLDRYLTWLFPLWLVYMAVGAVWLGQRLPQKALRGLPVMLLLAFHLLNALWLFSMYYSACVLSEPCYTFAKEAHNTLPPGASIGGSACNLAYGLPGRRYIHLSGLYSPDLATPEGITNIERLKYHPELRFDYWSFPSSEATSDGSSVEALCGSVAVLGADEHQMRTACWDALEYARQPVGKEIKKQLRGWRLVDELDIGYAEDEKQCGYHGESRFYKVKYEPFGVGSNTLYEVGRVVVGWHGFSLHGLTPHKPLRMVVRSALRAETKVRIGVRVKSQSFTFQSPLKIRIRVDDVDAGIFELPLEPLVDAPVFCENVLTVPAELINRKDPEITLYGDHVAFGYWFYQHP